jgi:hypothetical protein
VVNGGQLGNTPPVEKGFSSGETMSSFIGSIPSPTKGDTYIGNNGSDTFIFTDTTSGHTSAIEVVGVFANSTIASHVLTLEA